MNDDRTDRTVALTGTVGSTNYNLTTPASDVDRRTFLFPTLDDLYTNRSLSSTVRTAAGDESFNDVRTLPRMLVARANIGALEVLFGRDVQVVPDLRALVDRREVVARGNVPNLLRSGLSTARSTYTLAKRTSDRRLAAKRRSHALRTLLTVERFMANLAAGDDHAFAHALRFTGADRDQLLAVKGGEAEPGLVRRLFTDALRRVERLEAAPLDQATAAWVEQLVRTAVRRRVLDEQVDGGEHRG